jgi:hypothetical protein
MRYSMKAGIRITILIGVLLMTFSFIVMPVVADTSIRFQGAENLKGLFSSTTPSVSTNSWILKPSTVQSNLFSPTSLGYKNYIAFPSNITPINSSTFTPPSMPGLNWNSDLGVFYRAPKCSCCT